MDHLNYNSPFSFSLQLLRFQVHSRFMATKIIANEEKKRYTNKIISFILQNNCIVKPHFILRVQRQSNSTKFIRTLVQNHAKSSLHIQNLKVLLSLLQVIMTCIFIVPKYDNLEWSSGAFDQLEGTDITYFQRVISRKLCPTRGEFYIGFFHNVFDRPSSSIWNRKGCFVVIPFEVPLDKTHWYTLHG